MIKELIQFSTLLKDDFKVLGTKPKVGIHILLSLENKDGALSLNVAEYEVERCTKKTTESDYLEKCKLYHLNAWCIDTNKCFDLPMKAIHSCSPFCVAFKREHLVGGAKYEVNETKGKTQIYDRFKSYFEKSFELLETEEEKEKYRVFEHFFTHRNFEKIVNSINDLYAEKRELLIKKLEDLKEQQEKATKEEQKKIKEKIGDVNSKLLEVAEIDDGEYFIFYLDESLETYKKAHTKYLSDKLFNSDKYNTKPDEDGLIYGTNNFLNGFNVSKPFLMHKTASFDITGRISNDDALKLHEFQQVLRLNTIPNPLPIFIYEEELNEEVVSLFRSNEERMRYGEIMTKLYESHGKDLENYYLLFSQNTKDGLMIKDFDFVSKFEYKLKSEENNEDYWGIKGLFTDKYTLKIHNIFAFQNLILPVIFNNNLIVKTKDEKVIIKYFGEVKQEYCKSGPNYLSLMKYRQAFYEFVYKSRRKAITRSMFDDMMRTSILEDIRLDEVRDGRHIETFNIQKKLNIWFSLKEEFINTNEKSKEITMASKLKNYHSFMDDLVEGKVDLDKVTNEEFAYALGQLIAYVSSSSRSENRTYRYLEPYLQSTDSERVKILLCKDFKRYKHDIYKGVDVEIKEDGKKEYHQTRFQRAAEFVMTYDAEEKLDEYLPQMLAGIFGDNKVFKPKGTATTEKVEQN